MPRRPNYPAGVWPPARGASTESHRVCLEEEQIMADKLSAHRTPRGDSSSESSGLTKAPVGVLDAHRRVDAPTTQDVGRKRAQPLTAIGTRRRLAGGCFRSMVSVCAAAVAFWAVSALLAAAPAQAQTRTLSIERVPFRPASRPRTEGCTSATASPRTSTRGGTTAAEADPPAYPGFGTKRVTPWAKSSNGSAPGRERH